MTKVISFINLKGGVGKTTCCLNVSGNLAYGGSKVLSIDLDAQANLSTAILGEQRYQSKVMDNSGPRGSNTIFQLFLDAIHETKLFKPTEHIIKSAVEYKNDHPLPRLDLLPASYHLMRLEREIVNYERTKSRILSDGLMKFKSFYDYILIDCPPNIYTATHNALYASDYYVIPTVPDFLSSTGIPLLTRLLRKTSDIKLDEKEKSTELAGIIISMYDQRINVHREQISVINQMLGNLQKDNIVTNNSKVFDAYVRNLADVKKSLDDYAPICISRPRTHSAAEFRELTHEIKDHVS
ncbi:MAG: ParA family protein [Candidatus Hodarchaeales archaeon]|jgi:chromosome partitioning protein